jgi:hypothetical protein
MSFQYDIVMQKLFILTVYFLVAMLCSCSEAEKTYVSVVFDVEDYISPESDSVDNIPRWLAETMSEVGVTGTFFVIGEKARSLEVRGRQDVIGAMAAHDIGSHTNFGSIHPTVTEILEYASWDEGVVAMLENESAGFDDLERIFGVPAKTLARHGGSYGPQLVYALGQMGKGYVYSPVHLPQKNAVWFCNTLNFHGDYGYFDDSYYRDDLFNPLLDSLRVNFAEDIEGMDVVSFFACHPTKVRAEQFWDFNFYEGANPPPDSLKAPALRPAESMVTARKNFHRLMTFLKEQEDQGMIEITTYGDLMERFSYQPDQIKKADLLRVAGAVTSSGQIVYDEVYSPAEVFSGLVKSLGEYAESGRIPGKLDRHSPLGPMSMPPDAPDISAVSFDQVLDLAARAADTLTNMGYLPAALKLEDQTVGAGSLLHLFSAAYLDAANGQQKERYGVIPFDPYPRDNEEAIISEVEGAKYWIVHRPDLDMSHLVEMTRMQLWTLKPAHEIR